MLNRIKAFLSGSTAPSAASAASTPAARQPHQPHERDLDIAVGNEHTLDAVDRYIKNQIGACETVLHEIVSQHVHVDVHICKPGPKSDAWTLITSGMSDRPMPGAANYKVPPYAELMLRLPPSWPADLRGAVVPGKDDANSWPHRVLRMLARMPHEHNSALGPFHTLCFSDPPAPVNEHAPFVGVLLLPPIHLPAAAHTFRTDDGREVHVYSVHFLLEDEMAFKVEHGIDPLLGRFDQAGLSDILDVSRLSVLRYR